MRIAPRSIRLKLTLWYTGILFLFLLLFGGGVYLVTRRALYRELDRRLHEARERAEDSLVPGPDGRFLFASPAAKKGKGDEEHDEEGERAGWLEVYSRDGGVLYRSPWAARWPLPEGTKLEAFRPRSFYLGKGRCLRVASKWDRWEGTYVLIRVGRSERYLREALSGLLSVQALALPLVLLLAGV
ncbi:MAG TPA: hypothetical protein ENJ97_00555, partial [Planctomycetes bacterium]|nr:hypothetical protein [Planctomycetota bacterium]